MSVANDPIRLQPRLLPRRWGREHASAWCANALRPSGPIGEIWLAHPYNTTPEGAHFGALLGENTSTMLGDLGRAPPSLRLIITDEPSDPIASDGPVALWRMLECPLDATINIYAGERAPREMRCRRNDLVRLSDGPRVVLSGAMTALEARANFTPNNKPAARPAQRLLPVHDKKHRVTWLRDPALTVEAWTLPEISFLEPDGETCHVLMALTPGIAIEGEPLSRGDTIFLPAEGRRVALTGRGAEMVVCYPDLVPTAIWKHPHAPKPAALAIDPALMMRASMDASAAEQRAVA
jgi:hypothetical protein